MIEADQGQSPQSPNLSEIELVQEVDAVPVLDSGSGRALVKSVAPARQAMVAASGFVVGAAIVGLASRRRTKRAFAPSRRARRPRKAGGAGELVRIVGTRSLLVDVHLLDSR